MLEKLHNKKNVNLLSSAPKNEEWTTKTLQVITRKGTKIEGDDHYITRI